MLLAPDDSHAGVSPRFSLANVASSHATNFGHPEGGPYLGLAHYHVHVSRLQKPLERLVHLIYQLVDDVVSMSAYALVLCHAAGSRVGAYLEADDNSVGGDSQVDVRFADVARSRVYDVDL